MKKTWIAFLLMFFLLAGSALAFFSAEKNHNEINAVKVKNGKLLEKRIGQPFPYASSNGKIRILSKASGLEQEKALMEGKCSVVHRLIEGLALSCEAKTAEELLGNGLAEKDELLKLHDLNADAYIRAERVWNEKGIRGTGVTVAVLDSGVDDSHPEISDSIIAKANFARGPGGTEDKDGHGTHVIGIVTANGVYEITNTYGFPSPNWATGVAPNAGILSARVCGNAGCFTSDVSAGIEWAVAQGADVINLSLGGGNYGGHCDGSALAAKANWAVEQGTIVVASAGNENSGVSSPACGSKVIAVGAVYHADIGSQDYGNCADAATQPDQRVCFSNYGEALDVMAPGAAILSSYSCIAAGDCGSVWYAWMFGTSQSSPHVAALAALVLEKNSGLTPAEVKEIIESTARDLGAPGRDDFYGSGVIDALAAVNAATEEKPERRAEPVEMIVD